MSKTQEELNTIKEEIKTLNEKLADLTDEELMQVSGGFIQSFMMGLCEDTATTRDCYISAGDTKKTHPASCATAVIRCSSYERCCNPGKVYHE